VSLAAAVAGMTVVTGLLLAASALRPRPPRAQRASRRPPVPPARLGLCLAAGAAVLVVSRWPVAGIGAAIAAWWVPLPSELRARRDDDARSEAIGMWAGMLRDAVATGRQLEAVLVSTAPHAPTAIRPAVQRAARRLPYEPLAVVLEDLGDELAHPIGDLVVTALHLAGTGSGRDVRRVLEELAEVAYADAEMRRRVAVARQGPRSAMRTVALIVAAVILALIVFSRRYLEPYGTPLGQIVLALVGAYWAAGAWWMTRMGRVAEVPRFLARRAP